jgi:chromosome segregation ATPase
MLLLTHLTPLPLTLLDIQAKRETNDDRQREYEEKLQHHEAQMAQARQALAQAEGMLAEASQHKEGMRDAIAAKDQEVMQLKHRCVCVAPRGGQVTSGYFHR